MSDSSIYWYSHCWCLSTDKLHSAGTTNSYPKTFQLRERAGNLQATLCCQIKATWAPGSLLWLCGEKEAAPLLCQAPLTGQLGAPTQGGERKCLDSVPSPRHSWCYPCVGLWGKEQAAAAVLGSCSAPSPAPRPPSPGTCTQRHAGRSARCRLQLGKSLVSPASAWVMPSPLAGSQRLIMVSGSNFIFKMLLSKI